MKFYDEAKMAPVRKALEASVLNWPGVAPKEMMGCLVYSRGTKFFAFLVTHGLVITKLSEEDREALAEDGGKPFTMAGRTTAKWVQLPVKTAEDLRPLLPHVRASYEACR